MELNKKTGAVYIHHGILLGFDGEKILFSDFSIFLNHDSGGSPPGSGKPVGDSWGFEDYYPDENFLLFYS